MAIAPELPALLTPLEVAHALRLERESVYEKIRAGELRCVRLGSGPRAHIRVAASELARYLSANVVVGDGTSATVGDDAAASSSAERADDHLPVAPRQAAGQVDTPSPPQRGRQPRGGEGLTSQTKGPQ